MTTAVNAAAFLANLLYVVAHASVCRLQRSCNILRRLKFSTMFLCYLVPWPSVDVHVKFYGDRPRETPPWGLNARG